MKIITRLLTILVFGIVCSITTLIITNHSSNISTPIPATINVANEIHRDVVIEKLSNSSQIVGTQSDFSKSYNYADSNAFGKRSFALTIHGNFKMGFEVSDIINSMIIKGNTIYILTPKPILISFEAPFEDATIESKVGLLRRDFKEEDLQLLYKSASDKARLEIINNASLKLEAQKRTQKVVRDLLMMVPNVSSVEFVS